MQKSPYFKYYLPAQVVIFFSFILMIINIMCIKMVDFTLIIRRPQRECCNFAKSDNNRQRQTMFFTGIVTLLSINNLKLTKP